MDHNRQRSAGSLQGVAIVNVYLKVQMNTTLSEYKTGTNLLRIAIWLPNFGRSILNL